VFYFIHSKYIVTKQKSIDFYFSFISLYTYIGYEAFQELIRRNNLHVNYKPIDLHAIFNASGGLPVSKRPPQRQAYRLVEMQRWALTRGIPLVLKPKHHPSNPEIGHRMLLAALQDGQDVKAFIGNALKILWVDDQNIEDPEIIIAAANRSGLDGQALYKQSHEPEIQSQVDRLTLEGVEKQVFGTPFFFYKDESFWGQDRLEMLEELITSDREPILAPKLS
jgi:2-hydroxychromene-2-carboxylate isomerase